MLSKDICICSGNVLLNHSLNNCVRVNLALNLQIITSLEDQTIETVRNLTTIDFFRKKVFNYIRLIFEACFKHVS